MTRSRINIFQVLVVSGGRGTSFDIKIRFKFIEIKFSAPNRFIIFIINDWLHIYKLLVTYTCIDFLLASRGCLFRAYFIFTATGVVPWWRPLNVSPYRLYIFWPFGIIGLILSQFENRVPLKPVLGGVASIAPLPYCT